VIFYKKGRKIPRKWHKRIFRIIDNKIVYFKENNKEAGSIPLIEVTDVVMHSKLSAKDANKRFAI